MHWVMAASLRSVKNAVWHVIPCASPTKSSSSSSLMLPARLLLPQRQKPKVTKQKTLALRIPIRILKCCWKQLQSRLSGFMMAPSAFLHLKADSAARVVAEKVKLRKIPELIPALMEILDDYTYGNPESVLLYTNLSDRKLSAMLAEKGYSVGRNVVNRMLKALGWSKQQNKKLKQVGKEHPDRNVQFEFINATGKEVLAAGNPMISIDCKKKENIGDYANKGKEYRHSKDPRAVLDHDFLDKELGQVAPYGVYVVNNNTGFVNLGTTHDTSQFAVASIRAWWYTVGKNTFPDATMIYVTCDGGGSNSSRVRMFKTELAKLVEEIGIPIQISHFPPGTSKWNKVEHRLFSEISKSWAGKPLISVETVVQLIGSTTTTTGLKVTCQPDYNDYKTGLKASEEEYDKVDIEWINIGTSNKWNYIIHGLKKDS